MLIASIILLTLILMASVFHRINVPIIILSLTIGLVFGSDITGIIYFDDAKLAQELADIALMFILFIGGFGTKKQNLKAVFKPVALLATLGIIMTAAITGLGMHLLTGWPLMGSFLVGSILSSTDAAAVFSIMKNRPIKARIKSLTEFESVANDPMAVVLTMFVIDLSIGKHAGMIRPLLGFLWQMLGGLGIGVAIGYLAVYLFNKIRHIEAEYFYIYMIAIVMFSHGIASVCQTSGMLSAFFTGFVLGNKHIPYKKGLLAFNNTLSFITNIGLFILLGLLAFPRQFTLIWDLGVIVFLIITFVSRPITVFILTMFSGLSIKEKLFISAVGIRGAVPIVLATYPVAAGLDPNHVIFNVVFFTVTLSMLIQGTSLVKLAGLFKLLVKDRNKVPKILELVTVQDTNYEIIQVYIDEEFYEGSCMVSDLKLPPGTLITFISRDGQIVTPSGSTEIIPKDALTILVEKQNIELIPVDIMRGFVMKKMEDNRPK